MLIFRTADASDVRLYFDWANDPGVREQSYHSAKIDFESHKKWFDARLEDESCLMLVFQNENKMDIGQVRIQKDKEKEATIGISVAAANRGNGHAKDMLKLASDYFLESHPDFTVNAYIKQENLSSKYAFEKAGFEFKNITNYENFKSFHYIKVR